MSKLHEDYYLRKCFLERNQVPSQSVMKNKMGPALANVYFKSMSPKLKMIAGLEPPLKGGGKDWYVPPMDLLGGRAVMKPIHRNFLSMLSFNGVVFFGEKFVQDFDHRLEMEKQELLAENDLNWKKTIETCCQEQWKVVAAEGEQRNTLKIKHEFEKFTTMYRTSITKIESLLSDASQKEIQRVKNEAYKVMCEKFKILQEKQSAQLHNTHEENLNIEKMKYKTKFQDDIEKIKIDFEKEIHNINIEKHVAIEKLRTLLEYQNLACQVYVALKERTECNKELDISKRKYEKTIRKISDEIHMKDFEIKLAREKETKQNEINRMWQIKICHVVKKFQEFVKYCLNAMPDHADFFINMEKLMLLQLSDAWENPSAENMFESEDDTVETPVTPHPFYLVYDESVKPQIDQNLCPKHCTSSASQLPVIVVNKRCMYAACDNFELFIDKVKQFLDGQRGNDDDFVDDHDYTYDVPIDFTSSDHLRQLQLESSLMQILQNALPNVKEVPIKCCICRSSYCFCTSLEPAKTKASVVSTQSPINVPSGSKITQRSDELKHMREPKIDSYLDYIRPEMCKCAKTKEHLKEHLPPYMTNISKFERVDIPNYEICDLNDLKKLVRNSRKAKPKDVPPKPKTEFKNASTQCSDEEYDILCNCYSNKELEKLFRELSSDTKIHEERTKPLSAFAGPLSASYLEKQPSYFAIEAAIALKKIIRESPELQELFKKEDCTSENLGV